MTKKKVFSVEKYKEQMKILGVNPEEIERFVKSWPLECERLTTKEMIYMGFIWDLLQVPIGWWEWKMKNIFRTQKRKQCTKCYRTFYKPVTVYQYQGGFVTKRVLVSKYKGCPYCKSRFYVDV